MVPIRLRQRRAWIRSKKMTQAQIYTGSWEELNAHAADFQGRKNLTLIVPAEEAGGARTAKEHFYLTATPEEFQKAFDALGQGNENSPVLPPEAFDRESLYDSHRNTLANGREDEREPDT